MKDVKELINETVKYCQKRLKYDVDPIKIDSRERKFAYTRAVITFYLRYFRNLKFHEITALMKRERTALIHYCRLAESIMLYDIYYGRIMCDTIAFMFEIDGLQKEKILYSDIDNKLAEKLYDFVSRRRNTESAAATKVHD